jgi:hypothetical protein
MYESVDVYQRIQLTKFLLQLVADLGILAIPYIGVGGHLEKSISTRTGTL